MQSRGKPTGGQENSIGSEKEVIVTPSTETERKAGANIKPLIPGI